LAGRALPAAPPPHGGLIAREREQLAYRRDQLMLRRAEIDDEIKKIDRGLAGLRTCEEPEIARDIAGCPRPATGPP